MTKPEAKGGEQSKASHSEYRTVVLDGEKEYRDFVNLVYNKFGGRDLGLTNVPIDCSVRLTSWLQRKTKGRFHMRVLSEKEIQQTWDDLE